ncbi:MAG: ATP-dependent DNA helicase, partial [Acetobacteraceae bacterium]
MSQSRPAPPRLLLPDAPALIAGLGRATLLTTDGELLAIPAAELGRTLAGAPPLLVHGPATARRLDLPPFEAAFDLLELYAFCMPARPAAPTPRGLAMALDLPPPADDAAAAALLPQMATIMLRHLAAGRGLPLNRDAAMLAAQMEKAAGWSWA